MASQVQELVQRLEVFLASLPELVLAYLFGSAARGDLGPLSDVDVAVVFDESVPASDYLRRHLDLMLALPPLVNRRVDVVVLNEAPPLLSHRVIAGGKLILCRDETFRVRFETRRITEYLDTRELDAEYDRICPSGLGRAVCLVDREIVLRRVELIREYGGLLQELLKLPERAFVEDRDHYLKAERCLELVIQAMLDIGNHIISDRQFRRPIAYEEVFPILAENGAISVELSRKLQGPAGLRNILIHAYLKIDRARMRRELIEGETWLEDYPREVVAFLERPESGPPTGTAPDTAAD